MAVKLDAFSLGGVLSFPLRQMNRNRSRVVLEGDLAGRVPIRLRLVIHDDFMLRVLILKERTPVVIERSFSNAAQFTV